MLSEALTGLAAAGGTALVGAMVTDGWAAAKSGFAALFGRRSPADVATYEGRLDRAAARLAALEGEPLAVESAALARTWRDRLEELLVEEPDAEAELRTLVERLGGPAPMAAGTVSIRVHATDDAQVAVLGQGHQTNTFGRRTDG
ncbi:hypothetical protein AB0M43_16820 [Longispora sp. NPDC051575]|uniref:hypothetical protein n=1 Tax=Longispora sp. NPDC051575 TaxID=3154943 RepID=UPI00341A438E